MPHPWRPKQESKRLRSVAVVVVVLLLMLLLILLLLPSLLLPPLLLLCSVACLLLALQLQLQQRASRPSSADPHVSCSTTFSTACSTAPPRERQSRSSHGKQGCSGAGVLCSTTI